jgi:hypothetical protein
MHGVLVGLHYLIIYVGSQFGTGPVPALGHSHPQIGTMPIWGAQFQNRAPYSGAKQKNLPNPKPKRNTN